VFNSNKRLFISELESKSVSYGVLTAGRREKYAGLCRVVSCRILSCRVVSCPFLSRRVVSSRSVPCGIISFRAI
jgi:hypothetical protein